MKFNIEKILKEINFSERYLGLCQTYNDIDNAFNPKKKDINDILTKIGWELKYISREKIFSCDIMFNKFNFRFILPYKYGYIDCMYIIWNDKNRVRESFGDLAILIDESFNNSVKYKFPIATSLKDLNNIVTIIYEIHSDFLIHLKLQNTTT